MAFPQLCYGISPIMLWHFPNYVMAFPQLCYGISPTSAPAPRCPYAFLSLLFPTAPFDRVTLLHGYLPLRVIGFQEFAPKLALFFNPLHLVISSSALGPIPRKPNAGTSTKNPPERADLQPGGLLNLTSRGQTFNANSASGVVLFLGGCSSAEPLTLRQQDKGRASNWIKKSTI